MYWYHHYFIIIIVIFINLLLIIIIIIIIITECQFIQVGIGEPGGSAEARGSGAEKRTSPQPDPTGSQ